MPGDTILLRTLDFTHSVGICIADDETFSDVIKYGEFPFDQKIERITEIEVYSDTTDPQSAVLVGLKVKYELKDKTETPLISHGIVDPRCRVGQCSISNNEVLVGIYGQVKEVENSSNNGRMATISFVIFNKEAATLSMQGPFPPNQTSLGKEWANFGFIIALHGAKLDGVGLTSLGFVNILRTVYSPQYKYPPFND